VKVSTVLALCLILLITLTASDCATTCTIWSINRDEVFCTTPSGEQLSMSKNDIRGKAQVGCDIDITVLDTVSNCE
jgi:hypothetical protein